MRELIYTEEYYTMSVTSCQNCQLMAAQINQRVRSVCTHDSDCFANVVLIDYYEAVKRSFNTILFGMNFRIK